MKNLIGIFTLLLAFSVLVSCGSSPYKKRKACKGNGSWSGHRNLGAIDKIQKANQNTYVWTSEEIQTEKM